MNKLFVFQDNQDVYREELEAAFKRVSVPKTRIHIREFSEVILARVNPDVIVSNGLPPDWYGQFGRDKRVSITIGEYAGFSSLADIVIDCLSADKNRYFTGLIARFARITT